MCVPVSRIVKDIVVLDLVHGRGLPKPAKYAAYENPVPVVRRSADHSHYRGTFAYCGILGTLCINDFGCLVKDHPVIVCREVLKVEPRPKPSTLTLRPETKAPKP